MIAKNVLIFPAGTEIAFEIVNALKFSKFVKLYGGTSTNDHSEFIYKKLIKGFPYINEEGFMDYLNDVIQKYKIDCIYPAHDNACLFFSEHENEIKAQVIVTDKNTTKICRSKKHTYEYLAGETFIPKIFKTVFDVKDFPVFVKPAIGQGSQGAKKVNTIKELEEVILKDDSLIICEYLPGVEFTIDCFTDRYGNLRVVKMRDRQRIRTGISMRSQQMKVDKPIQEMAKILNQKLHFLGAWFFQVKKDKFGKYKLMEISPRIPGTMGLSRNLGINFPMLTLFVFWGSDVDIIENNYDIILDRAFYSAYKINYTYKYIYVDFDDTLVLIDRVNENLMYFIYQSINDGKKIYLLSKHIGDIHMDLKKFKISEELFEDIIVIHDFEEKQNYIKERPAIFIDDSFEERKKVHKSLSIPVFDVDMVESLIDWKI